jgi:hypothetical protein
MEVQTDLLHFSFPGKKLELPIAVSLMNALARNDLLPSNLARL